MSKKRKGFEVENRENQIGNKERSIENDLSGIKEDTKEEILDADDNEGVLVHGENVLAGSLPVKTPSLYPDIPIESDVPNPNSVKQNNTKQTILEGRKGSKKYF